MNLKRKLYLTLGIVGILVAAFAMTVKTGLIQLPMAWVEIGPSNLTSVWSLKTTRPDAADQLPIVIKTLDGVEGPYIELHTNGEKSGP